MSSNSKTTGKVYLVGAGVGNLDYLTLRGKQLLSIAEVLIYDALVDPQLWELVPNDCLKLDVGKRGGLPSTSQDKINQLLVAYCSQGKQVVRLKSGDPLVFGRSNEEIEALTNAGCDFELVPGISSALAAPLLAGIPLTDKFLSSCFAVLTAHNPESLDWQTLARIDTLVILMGARSLAVIIQELLHYGRSPLESIAIIRNSSRQDQQVWIGTLTDILDKTNGVSLSPAVIVIGEVVQLRKMPQLQSLPLSGKTILVTRAVEQSSNFTQMLQQQGATVIEMPALAILPPSSWQALDEAIASLDKFDWLILTSANGVEYFFERLKTLGYDARALAKLKIAVVGKKTAHVLEKFNIQADFIPPDFVADSLVENFPESLVNKKILFPRVETGGREVLVKELTLKQAEVVEVAAYQSGCPAEMSIVARQALQEKTIDIITFASSKTVKNFSELLEKTIKSQSHINTKLLLEKVCIASIGPQTSQTCHELLGRVDIEAKEYTLEGLTQAIVTMNNKSH